MNNTFNIRQIIRVVLYFIFAFSLNHLLRILIPANFMSPDLWLTLPWVLGYFYGETWGVWSGLTCGFIRDWLFGSILGPGALLGLITGFLSAHLLARRFGSKPRFLILQGALLQMIDQILILFFYFILPNARISYLGIWSSIYYLIKPFPLTLLMNLLAVVGWLILIRFLLPLYPVEKSSIEGLDVSQDPREVI